MLKELPFKKLFRVFGLSGLDVLATNAGKSGSLQNIGCKFLSPERVFADSHPISAGWWTFLVDGVCAEESALDLLLGFCRECMLLCHP